MKVICLKRGKNLNAYSATNHYQEIICSHCRIVYITRFLYKYPNVLRDDALADLKTVGGLKRKSKHKREEVAVIRSESTLESV